MYPSIPGREKTILAARIDLGGRRVSARICEVGDLQSLLVQTVHAEHRPAAAHAMVSDRAENLATLDLVVHLSEITGPAKVFFLHPPGDSVQFGPAALKPRVRLQFPVPDGV